MKQIKLTTTKQKEVVDITAEVEDALLDAKVQEGIVHLFATHTTCCITTADLDPGTDEDMLEAIAAIMPNLNYRHPHNPKHVVDHIASSIIGPSLLIPVENGELTLGTWQRIVLIELDGPKERTVMVRVT